MMMHNGKAGVALSVTVLALLLFSIAAFYGMEYLYAGNHAIAVSSTFIGLTVLSVCIYFMCKSKSSRNKRSGLPIEIVSMSVACFVLVLGSIPFNIFMSAIDHEKAFVGSITETARNVRAIDSSYQAYVNQRVTNYEGYLKTKNYRTTAVRSMVNSLKRRLTPENMDLVCFERQLWLSALDSVSIWNVSTAKNIRYIVTAGEDWCRQYRLRSSLFYEGEDTTQFEFDKSLLASQSTYERMRAPHLYGGLGLLTAVFCFIGIFTTYFFIRRPRNRYSGHHR